MKKEHKIRKRIIVIVICSLCNILVVILFLYFKDRKDVNDIAKIEVTTECSEFEKLCSNGKSGIVCYRFNVLAMHFFAFQINNGYICFNRRSDDTSQVTATTVSKAIGSSSKTRRYFYVGYVLY